AFLLLLSLLLPSLLIMFIPSTFKRPVSSWKALNLRKTLLMASSVRLKPLNCSRLPCVYAQETLTFLLTQKKTCVKNYVQKDIQMDTSVNAANQVVSVGADIAFDADPKFFACLVRFESSSVPTTLQTAYDVYPLDGRHDGGYYTVKDCVTIDVLPRTPGNNVYVGFMVWSNFTATKCRGLVSLNQVIKEIICLQPLK